MPALGQCSADSDLLGQLENQIDTPCFARTHVLHSLCPAILPGTLVLAGKEIYLNLDFAISHNQGAAEDKRLLVSLSIAMGKQKLQDRLVPNVTQSPMVKGQIDIDTSDVLLISLRQQQLGYPTANDDDVISILAQDVHDLQ